MSKSRERGVSLAHQHLELASYLVVTGRLESVSFSYIFICTHSGRLYRDIVIRCSLIGHLGELSSYCSKIKVVGGPDSFTPFVRFAASGTGFGSRL